MKNLLSDVTNVSCESNSTIKSSEPSRSEYLQSVDNVSVKHSKRHKMDKNVSDNLEITPLVPSTSEVNLTEDSLSVPLVSKQLNCFEEGETVENQNTTIKRVWNKSDNCIYCKNNVTNFTRHVVRKHKNEIEVKKFVALPKGSPERKLLADLLRKRGNFFNHVDKGNDIRIVRCPNKKTKKSTTVSDYLPCTYCLGMFRRKFLHRHLKICKHNTNKIENSKKAQADGQNLLIDLSGVDYELVEKVFSRMASDNISFVAKSDKLITTFGTKCLKSCKDKRLITYVSQKMRTLARFLISMRDEVNTIHSLQDCLFPNYFNSIVKCAKKNCRHNKIMDNSKPSFAFINLGNLLKNCCDVAVELITLEKSDGLLSNKLKEDRKSIKNVKKLILNNWSNQFASLDLNSTEQINSNNSEVECLITSFIPNTVESMSNKNNNNNNATVSLKCFPQVYNTNTDIYESKNENSAEMLHQNTKEHSPIPDKVSTDNNNFLTKINVDNNTENKNSNDYGTTSSSTEIQTPQKGPQCYESDSSDLVDDVETSSEKNSPRKTITDKTNYCLFCKKNVTNFARHLVRKHKNEKEVIQYDSLPKGSAERKFQVDLLRKRGNFLNHVQNGNKMKLVRRPKEFETKSISVGDYLPCKFCLGMFKKRLLHRHVKKCKNNKNEGKNRAQADGQNLMLNLTDIDEELVSNVFSRMVGDNISFVAKSDKLITSFGVKYLKSHKDKKLIISVSQKMRILARFLIAMRSEVSSVHSLQDCLNPKYFDSIIKCTKQIGQYNEKTDIYESPTNVVKLGALLNNCCDIALELIISKENDSLLLNTLAEDQESIKNIKYMIDVNWAYQFMSINKKYSNVVDETSTNESCIAAYNNISPEINLNNFISSENNKHDVTAISMNNFGHQQGCKTDATFQKLNSQCNTDILHKNTKELYSVFCNSGLSQTDVVNEEYEKNNTSMTVSSLKETQITTIDSQHCNSALHGESNNAEMDTEFTHFSYDGFTEDSIFDCLPSAEDHDVSINNLIHHKADSNILEKCENSQLILNTNSNSNFSESNIPTPFESDNSNVDNEIQTRSKTVKKCKKMTNLLENNSNTSNDSNLDEEIQTMSKSVTRKKTMKEKLNYCLFCEKNITNFTRHLVRNHKNEIEVVKYESLPKNSIERKLQADLLRKRGNFLCHVEKRKEIKVVRRSKGFDTKSNSVNDYLPCKYCFGMFKKKYLHRHLKVCKNIKNQTVGRNRAQADGQNMMLKFDNIDEKLVENIFPRMACDDISFVAKSDKLITSFVSSYLKCNNDKQSIASVSQKMRLLARFVIAMKDEISTICSLQDCLTPEHFETIVKCSKKVAQFNEKTNSIGSRSTVVKLGQLLKHCCDEAMSSSLKESANELVNSNEKDKESFKNIKYMIENHWLYKLSTNDFESNLDNCYSPTLRSLTSDIILLRDNIKHFEQEAYYHLKSNPNNVFAYQNLQESILVQIVLLNRCQSDEEIQNISLEMFNNSLSDISHEKITQALSPTEQNISKYFKCINIQGKHGEIVPIKLTLQLYELVQYLLKLRATANFINHANPCLFPLMHSSNSSMSVSDAIFKFGNKSGAENLENITSTCFKNYVATIMQLLNLTEEDIEHLSTLIGYNKYMHIESCRLTDNVFEVAKLCKFLLLKEKSGGHEYQEKSLDDINISVDDFISADEDLGTNDEDKYILDQTFLAPDSSNKQKSVDKRKLSLSNTILNKRQNKKRDLKRKIVLWSAKDKYIITKYFENHIILGKAPKKQECEELSQLHPQINKHWKKIKDFVHNATNAQKRNNNTFCNL